MSLNEFDLIKHYFQEQARTENNGVALGIGDDCALLEVPDGYQLAISTDTLVCDVHFFADVDPYRLGYKALAVNLSDLAAMGATPKWISLALTLPDLDKVWLAEFSRGFFALANKFNVSLVGGDTTKGPLSITVSVQGIIPRGLALRRDQAHAGELICISGYVGDAALGLGCKLKQFSLANERYFIDALERTEPHIEIGRLLRGLASSCIDISDGLTQDLQHILHASRCGAQLELEKLPLSPVLAMELANAFVTDKQAINCALTGGDDYGLLFTISDENLCLLKQRIQQIDSVQPNITVIGSVTHAQRPLIALYQHKQVVSFSQQGWDHFR